MGFMVDGSGNVYDAGPGVGYQSPEYALAISGLKQDYVSNPGTQSFGVQDQHYADALLQVQTDWAASQGYTSPVAASNIVQHWQQQQQLNPDAPMPSVFTGDPVVDTQTVHQIISAPAPPPVVVTPPPVWIPPVVVTPEPVPLPLPPPPAECACPGGSGTGLLDPQGICVGCASIPTIPIILPPPSPAPVPVSAPGGYQRKVTLSTTPPAPSQAELDAMPPPQPVQVRVAGRQRTVTTAQELADALAAGGTYMRTDGTSAIIQEVWAPGWATPGYLIDGNPMNVVQGQGWFAVQRPLVQQLADQGLIPHPTMWNQPTIAGSLMTPIVIGAWYTSPLVLAGGAGLLWYFWPRRRSA